MPRTLKLTLAALSVALFLPVAHAALNVGATAPDFSADSAVGGQPFKFHLADALKNGPVVLYFYPKAFTSGCTVEAHQFAEASDRFKALGATVIGMSNDDIDTLKKFSVEACRNKFAVAADAGAKVMKDYDAALRLLPGMADRVSYLIGTDGRIAAVHASMSPEGHIDAMLKAVQQLKK
ncbi:peroxiredoxin [Roseateles saccharophilus]|uniref:thioredoxin-dependent peroxiredoxin n=1 Tax=Roseateles saccharophilus TaxID=304 RepID=A0A4R3VJB3_ROSSA|nr:peroxiredoxin [Roseateles saccharophilus]MDG0831371.1 peroxiredoxin [Roseateles saccharophilus]TCV04501.1 peroxiredoxin [Roseateles saccharophilus]